MVMQLDTRGNPIRTIWGLLLALLLVPAAAAVEVTVAVNPNPPVLGESFRIAFEVTGELDEEPDFGPIEQRFDIIGRNRQTSIQWVNGVHTRTTTFILEVLAKPGTPLEVPAIAFGDTHTAPLTLQATASAPATPVDDGLFIEIDAVPRDPYVQQQVIYTIRLWRRYELSNASLSEPRLRTDAIVKPLGEDRQFEAERDGKRYEVIERRFALFPQVSGPTVIEPVTVTAQVLERAASLFEMFGRAVKTRRVSSAPFELDVRPIPATYPRGAAWMPASKLRLNELWEPQDLRVKAGDPVTRTLSLWAVGLTSGQLAEIAPPVLDGLKAYPDQPQLKEDVQDGMITAIRQEKAALIPTDAGTLQLPAVEIPWWNVDTNTLEYARLPARTVIANADPAQAPPSTPVVAPSAPAQPGSASAPAPAPAAAVSAGSPDWRQWSGWWLVACGAVVGWIASLAWALQRRRGQALPAAARPGSAPTPAEAPSRRAAREALARACAASDAHGARAALLTWARAEWPDDPPLTLGAITPRVDAPFAQAIADLDAALYGRTAQRWQGDLLNTALAAHLRRPASTTAAVDTLPGIFRLAH